MQKNLDLTLIEEARVWRLTPVFLETKLTQIVELVCDLMQ